MIATENVRVTEIFYSLQGEGKTAGMPTVFVRLTGCPLRCQYCDTEYAFSGGQTVTFDSILAEVRRHQCPLVTITGGEPLAQPNCLGLMRLLCDEGFDVSIETSGALSIANCDPRVSVVLDLKTPGSGEVNRNDWNNLDALSKKDQIKFVICDERDYAWAKAKMLEGNLLDRAGEILLSPSFGQQCAQDLAQWILRDRLPVRMQLQLHKQIWGDEAGR